MKQDLFNNYTQLKINTGSVATISNIQTSAHKNINDALQSANKLDSNYVEQKQYICAISLKTTEKLTRFLRPAYAGLVVFARLKCYNTNKGNFAL